LLELENIHGGYGDTTILRGVSVSIPTGSVVALLGPNGAGKSTALRMASGLLRPTEGRILLDGRDITAEGPSDRSQLGLCHITEGRSLFPSLTVRENLLLQARRGVSSGEVLARADEVFPQLSKRHRQVAGTLSGGEQQMVALMRAYLAGPRVVLVDEASLGLAPLVVDQIFEFLERVAGEGMSLLIVEQYVNRALAIASVVYVLSQGHVVHRGLARELTEEQIYALYSQRTEGADLA
jgi:branched-chain amino acid transport system ATP-binding protein